jgi:predicted transcriptional regulator
MNIIVNIDTNHMKKLDNLAFKTNCTKSEVISRAIEAYERELIAIAKAKGAAPYT